MPRTRARKTRGSVISQTAAVTEERRKSIFDCDDESLPSSQLKSPEDSESDEGSLVVRKKNHKRKVYSDSESDSSSDEFLRAPVSLNDLDDFVDRGQKTFPSETAVNSTANDSDSDGDEKEVSEYFDFTSIIQSQQLLKDLAVKPSPAVPEPVSAVLPCPPKNPQSKNKATHDVLNVSELLAIGEGRDKFEQKESQDEEEEEEDDAEKPADATPRESVEITIKLPDANVRPKKKKFDLDAAVKRRINSIKKEHQVFVHKVHLLCLIAHGNFVNSVLNSEDLLGVALSIVPSDNFYPPQFAGIEYLEKLVTWFSKKVQVSGKVANDTNFSQGLMKQFNLKEARSRKELVFMFICVCRVLGLKCRLIMSLQPLPLKPLTSELCSLSSTAKDKSKDKSVSKEHSVKTENQGKKSTSSKNNKKAENDFKSNYFESPEEQKATRRKRKNDEELAVAKPQKVPKKIGKKEKGKSKEEDDDFTLAGPSPKKKAGKKVIDRKILSDDEPASTKPNDKKKKSADDVWAEVFLEAEEKWISVDVCRAKVHCIQQLYSCCTHPVSYVLAWNNDQTIKDLTRRYAPQWMTATRKMRVDVAWWDETLLPWKPKNTAIEREENWDLDKKLEDEPLPKSISEFKSHPLYALRRHLLKFEAIYPPDAPSIGFIRGEPIFSRLCVVQLHSRETWVRKAKLVRRNETPYKIVKARPKYDKMTGTVVNNLPLELFGHWQVEDYIAPPAVDGKVPRNEYGNVELYQPSMLPPGTVHIPVPGLCRVAKKLNIDCAPAVVGWEFHSGGSHPVFDGFIICEEFKDVLLDAWNKEIDESAKRAKEKVEQRVYGNWKRLIRGLIIRERLQKRYNFGPAPSKEEAPKKKSSKRKQSNK